MKKLVVAVFALMASVSEVQAGKTQVNADVYKAAGKTGNWYGRSDGVFQDVNTKSPYSIENGTSAGPMGAGFYESFTGYGDGQGLTCEDQGGMGACGGNASVTPCVCTVGSGFKFIWMPDAQQDVPPDMDAASLDIAGDQNHDDGARLYAGVGGASGIPFHVGGPAFFTCATLAVEDSSGAELMVVGFQEVGNNEAYNADLAAQNSYATIGPVGTEADGFTIANVTTETEDDGTGIVTTDTTDNVTDATSHTYCVKISSAGAATYTVDGAQPTTVVAFTFDAGIEVVPIINFNQSSDLSGEIDLTMWEAGYQD